MYPLRSAVAAALFLFGAASEMSPLLVDADAHW
jgi:hypothetical protein